MGWPQPTRVAAAHRDAAAHAVATTHMGSPQLIWVAAGHGIAVAHGQHSPAKTRTRCVFELDMTLHTETAVHYAYIGIVGLVLAAILTYLLRGRHKNHEANTTAIERARVHRQLCKVADWQLGGTKAVC